MPLGLRRKQILNSDDTTPFSQDMVWKWGYRAASLLKKIDCLYHLE